MKKQKKNLRSLTLIEIMVTIALIAMISSVFCFSIQRSTQDVRYSSDIALLESRITQAKWLSVGFRMDTEILLQARPSGLLLTFTSQKKGPSSEQDSSKTIQEEYKSLHALFINGERVDEISLHFYSHGVATPKIILEFSKDPHASSSDSSLHIALLPIEESPCPYPDELKLIEAKYGDKASAGAPHE